MFESLSRRSLLRGALMGAAGAVLMDRLDWPVLALPAGPAAGPRARAVIQIWVWGGPSHLDTFDPKPDAGPDYTGPLAKAIPTNVEGIVVNESLPLLAQQADKYAIIRSMTHGNNGHETAAYIVQTGRTPGERLVYPSAGAVVNLFKGYDQGYSGLIPPYIVLTELQGRFSESGFLGQRYKPFATGGDPRQTPFAVEGIIAQGISEARQKDRRQLRERLDALGAALGEHAALDEFRSAQSQAYDLILGDAGKVFDLAQETDAMREAYGRTTFGQSCLMARRLVERGVPYITINYKGWDTHKQHFQEMRRKLPEMDKAMSALLADLSQRGLLDATIVWWSGEFGRTPKVQWEAPWNGGRGHYGKVFSAVVAGGGFKGGRVVGASDTRGEDVKDRLVHPADLIATLYQLLGIDGQAVLPNSHGADVRAAPAAPPGARSDGPLVELI